MSLTTALLLIILAVLTAGMLTYFYFQKKLSIADGELTQAQKKIAELEQIRIHLEEKMQEKTKETQEQYQQLKDQFALLAQEALKKNLEEQLKTLKQMNEQDLNSKKQSFDQTFDEIKKHLHQTGEKIATFEKDRIDQFAKIEKQIQSVSEQEQKLIQETERLKSALTTSQSVRGRWGELVLRNILKQSDLIEGIDYNEQSHHTGDDGSLKPDFVIHLPQSGQHLVIDSKASLFESYLEGHEAKNESERMALHQGFAKKLRSRIQELSQKEYQKFVADSLPYVILFVPSEAAIRAAFEVDPEIFQYAMDRKIFLSSPATILPLVMLIAQAWRQQRLSQKASELSEVIQVLGSRLETFVNRLSRVQGGLETATKAWNEAIDKSWNGQQSVTKSLEKAKELGGELPELNSLKTIDSSPKAIE